MRIPALTTEQMAEVDRMMIEVYHIELIQIMENAGRNLADESIPEKLYQGLVVNIGPIIKENSKFKYQSSI